MKKLLALFSLIALLVLPSSAQTNTPSLWDSVLNGIGSMTNYSIAPYFTYGLDNKKVGGGVLVLYNINNYIGAGLGGDYLDKKFSAVSAELKLQLPISLAPVGMPNSHLSPFALTSIGTPVSGAGLDNGDVSTYAGVGAYLDFAKLLGGNFGVGGAYGSRTGAESYSGKYINAFFKWSKGF